MRRVFLNLVSDGGDFREKAEMGISNEHWQLFSEYIEEADILRATTFVRKSMGSSLTVTFRQNESVFSRSQKPEDDATGQMLMKLRPFILQGESSNFNRTMNLARKYCVHPVLNEHLTSIRDHFKLRAQEQKMIGRFASRPVLNEDILNWLNGFEYHRDKLKREKALNSLGIYGEDQNGKPFVLFAITDMLRAILALSDFLETLKNHGDGFEPVGFPETWVKKLNLK